MHKLISKQSFSNLNKREHKIPAELHVNKYYANKHMQASINPSTRTLILDENICRMQKERERERKNYVSGKLLI
jgi:hypothetical protein